MEYVDCDHFGLPIDQREIALKIVTRWLADRFPQRLTPGAVRILQLRRHADLTKAKTELGYKPTSIRKACAEAYEFFARRGAIRNPNPQRIVDFGGDFGGAGDFGTSAQAAADPHAAWPQSGSGCPVAH